MFVHSTADDRYKVTVQGDLKIRNIQHRDEGFYTCTALNNVGSVSTKVYLKIGKVPEPLLGVTVTVQNQTTIKVAWNSSTDVQLRGLLNFCLS